MRLPAIHPPPCPLPLVRSAFISYSAKDVAFAETIEDAITTAGLDAWRDQTRLETDWPREIALALSRSDALVLLWSGHSAESKWVRHEWLTARALEKPIIVCFLDHPPDLPTPLANLHGVRFDNACKSLCERLTDTPATAQYDYTVLPPNSYIPFNPNPDFRGRQQELLDLYLDLIGNLRKIGICQAGRVGMGGVGKTQLAVEFAYRFSYAFEHVFWVDATDPNRWMDALLNLGRVHFGISVSGEPGSRHTALLELQRNLKHSLGALLILDNVADPLQLNSDTPLESAGLTALTLGSNLLFTSRKAVSLPGVRIARVDVLDPPAALALLTRHREPAGIAEEKAANDICAAVGNLPLAIVLVAAFMASREDVSFSDYYSELKSDLLDAVDLTGISDEQLATRHTAAVASTFRTQWDALDNDQARVLLRLAALLPESSIVSKALLVRLAGFQRSASPVRDPVARAFAVIRDLHLAEDVKAGSAVRLHPLIRESVLRTIEDPASLRLSSACRVRDAYNDPGRLELDCRERGIREIAADVRLARSWIGAAVPENLDELARILDHEAETLEQQWPVNGYSPALFYQQLQYRASIMGLVEAAKAFEAVGVALGGNLLIRSGGSGSLAERLALRAHTNSVTGSRFLGEGRTALTCSWDRDLILWDLESGIPIRRLQGHRKVVNCLAVDRSGKVAITGSDDHTIAVWDVESGVVVRRLIGHEDYVLDVCLSDDGSIAVSGERGGSLIAWNVDTGARLAPCPDKVWLGPKGSVALTPDGTVAIAPVRPEDKTTFVSWRVASGEVIARWKMPESIWGVCFGQVPGTLFFSALNAVYACDISTQTIKRKYYGPKRTNPLLGVVRSRSGILAAGGASGTVVFWDENSSELIAAHRGHPSNINDIDIDSAGQSVITASTDKAALWDSRVPSSKQETVHSDSIEAITFMSDSCRMMSTDGRGIALWDRSARSCIEQRDLGHRALSVETFSSDGRYVFGEFGAEDYRLYILGQQAPIMSLAEAGLHHITGANLSPNGKLILASESRRLHVIAADSSKILRFAGMGTMVHSIGISEDNRLALLGCDYGELRLVNMETLELIASNHDNQDSILAVAMDASARLAVTSRFTGTIEVRALPTFDVLARMFVGDKVHAVAIQGHQIVLGDNRGDIHFLELSRG